MTLRFAAALAALIAVASCGPISGPLLAAALEGQETATETVAPSTGMMGTAPEFQSFEAVE